MTGAPRLTTIVGERSCEIDEGSTDNPNEILASVWPNAASIMAKQPDENFRSQFWLANVKRWEAGVCGRRHAPDTPIVDRPEWAASYSQLGAVGGRRAKAASQQAVSSVS